MGGKPERMSWVSTFHVSAFSRTVLQDGYLGLCEEGGYCTHVVDRAAHGVQCEFSDRVQASGNDLERGQDCLR